MDPFSLALGVLAVVQTTASAVETLYDFVHTIQHAPEEIRSLMEEANNLHGILRRINEALLDPKIQTYISKHPDIEQELASLNGPLKQCNARISTVMISLEKLTDRDASGKRTFKKYRWYFEKHEIVSARQEMAQARSNATFAFTGLNFIDNLRANAERESLAADRESRSRSTSMTRIEEFQRRDEALRKAAIDNNLDIMRLSLDDGAPVDSKDADGRTALSFAAEHGNIEAVELLLAHKAFVNSVSNDVAVGSSWFKKQEGTRTPLHWAAVGGHILVAEKLLDAGANIEAKTNSQWTAVMGAANAGHYKTVKFLIERGANVQARTYRGWGMLHVVAGTGRVDIAQLLIDHGVDVEAVYSGTKGQGSVALHPRPLHVAVQTSSKWSPVETTAMIELLVQKGKAQISAQDVNGWTALHYAVHYKSKAALKVLVKYATISDLGIKSTEPAGQTVLVFAQHSGDQEMVDLVKNGSGDIRTSSRSPMRLEETFP